MLDLITGLSTSRRTQNNNYYFQRNRLWSQLGSEFGGGWSFYYENKIVRVGLLFIIDDFWNVFEDKLLHSLAKMEGKLIGWTKECRDVYLASGIILLSILSTEKEKKKSFNRNNYVC